jgi:hypothetical protein
MLKGIIDTGKKDYYDVLMTMTVFLILILAAMLVLSFIIYGPRIKWNNDELENKLKELRRQIELFRSKVRKINPFFRGMRDDEVVNLFEYEKWDVLDLSNTKVELNLKEEYYDAVIKHYKEHYPKDVKDENGADKGDEVVWVELKDKLKEVKVNQPTREDVKKHKNNDTMNDVLSGLSAIALVLMVLINVFKGNTFSL